jgi:hypothetical protein
LPWHWSVKYLLCLGAATAVLLVSYHCVVRFTFIGAVLNGRRVRWTSRSARGNVIVSES